MGKSHIITEPRYSQTFCLPKTLQKMVMQPDKSFVLEESTVLELSAGGAIVETIGCGLCGSDLDKWMNRQMNAPFVLGHEVVGRFIALSEGAMKQHPNFSIGQRVAIAHHAACNECYYCLNGSPTMCRQFKKSQLEPGGFSTYIALSSQHLAKTVFPVQESVSDMAASSVEPLACCIRAVSRLSLQPGHHVAVVGLGFIGCLISQCLQIKEFQVIALDLKLERKELAFRNQWVHAATTHAQEFVNLAHQATDNRGVDAVVLTTVNSETLQLAFSLVRDGGYILGFTSSKQPSALLDQNQLYFRELTYLTSYSPSPEQLKEAAVMINNNLIHVDPLYDTIMNLVELPAALQIYQEQKAIKVFIRS